MHSKVKGKILQSVLSATKTMVILQKNLSQNQLRRWLRSAEKTFKMLVYWAQERILTAGLGIFFDQNLWKVSVSRQSFTYAA